MNMRYRTEPERFKPKRVSAVCRHIPGAARPPAETRLLYGRISPSHPPTGFLTLRLSLRLTPCLLPGVPEQALCPPAFLPVL